jgi:hypothetical protein
MNARQRFHRTLATLLGSAFLVMLLASTTAAPLDDVPATEEVATVECFGEPIPLIDLPQGDVPTTLLLEQCPGIRPGARLSNGCTMNFVFEDTANLYIGTAGHCTSFVGQRMGATGMTGTFGTVVYRYYGGVGWDFALILVDEDKRDLVDPNLCAFHGPLDADPSTHQYQPVHHYGWGVATMQNSYQRARTGYILWTSPTTVHFMSYASGGDSGSPLNNVHGDALGIITHVQSNVYGDRLVYGTHITQALAMARGAGFDVQLVPGQLVEGVI